MNPLHVRLAKTLHIKTGVALSSLLATPQNSDRMRRAVDMLRDPDQEDGYAVGAWAIQTATDPRQVTTHGVVYCSYADALRTAVCLTPVFDATMEKLRKGNRADWRGWVNVQAVPYAFASADDIAASKAAHERTVLFFDEWLTTKRTAVHDRNRWLPEEWENDEAISVAVYGNDADQVAIMCNSHTDDLIVRYGNLEFFDNIEIDVEAVAYKVYLCLKGEISEDELATFFPSLMRAAKQP